jgi:tRNA-dependent cyclodipeptide synthase
MDLYRIRGGNKHDLDNKKYTIGVGISLGNKWFSVESILSLVNWALQYSKDKVVIYVADEIHAINLEVRNKISYEKALEKANRQGDKVLKDVKSKIETELPAEMIDRIEYVKWQEITDKKYKQKVNYLNSLYNQKTEFKDFIFSLVKDVTSREERIFSEAEINRLGEYVIEELPEIINRVPMKGIICDAYIYPFDGKLTQITEEIQNGDKFSEIKENIMDTEPKVFLEVR